MIDPELPITDGDLARWSAELDSIAAARAEVVVGLDFAEFGMWAARRSTARATGQLTGIEPFLSWSAGTHQLEATATGVAATPSIEELDVATDPDVSFRWTPAPLRLAVRGPTIPTEVAPRLLRVPGVGSVVVPIERPSGALRRRAWEWPMRLGIVDTALAELLPGAMSGVLPSSLLDVSDVRVDPGAVDILVLSGSLDAAVDTVRRLRPVANVVVIAGVTRDTWPTTDAAVRMITALTGAVAVVLTPGNDETVLAVRVARILRYVSHGHTLDVSFTAAFDRDVMIVGELDALTEFSLPHQIRERAVELRADLTAIDDPAILYTCGANIDSLEQLADGGFNQEQHEASAAPPQERLASSTIDDAAPERELQLRVRPSASPDGPTDNVLRTGANQIEVFVGPPETGALHGLAMTNELLGFTASSRVVRLTAVLAPLAPGGDPVRAEFDVPRTGRSETATLSWTIPEKERRAEARIIVLHRNRVIQTAILSGAVGGRPARLTERIILWNDLGDLDDRRPFDLAVVLNHGTDGKARAIGHSSGRTEQIVALPELERVSDRIRTFLIAAAFLKGSGAARDAKVRKLLIDVAVEGRSLRRIVQSGLTSAAKAERIQIVTARPSWFLPLEFVYERDAPDEDATVCQRWLASEECGDACFPDADEHKVVCPSAFWGMSRVIERHWVDAVDATATSFLVGASPKRRRRRLAVDGAVVAGSVKVKDPQIAAIKATLGADTVIAKGWSQWAKAIKESTAANLLVLMPHTDAAADTMEISETALRTGRIEPVRHVTGGRETHPVVVLFGCDTTGSKDNPAGYATLFMQSQAGVVFATLTMLLNTHAVELSKRLVVMLRDSQRPEQAVGDLVRDFRREAVRAGLIAALAITAYGDADWNV